MFEVFSRLQPPLPQSPSKSINLLAPVAGSCRSIDLPHEEIHNSSLTRKILSVCQFRVRCIQFAEVAPSFLLGLKPVEATEKSSVEEELVVSDASGQVLLLEYFFVVYSKIKVLGNVGRLPLFKQLFVHLLNN